MASKEELAQTGFVMFMDIHEGRYLFALEVAEGRHLLNISLAIFWALHGRFADPESPDDRLAVLGGLDIINPYELIKAKAVLHLKGESASSRPDLGFEKLEPVADALRKIIGLPAVTQRKHHRREDQAGQRQSDARRESFNAQHARAPEGTVKELAVRYGRSLGEIRRLKAEGLLHTLAQS